MSPNEGTPGNGVLLFFRVDDFDMALRRARALVVRFEEEPHVNPNTLKLGSSHFGTQTDILSQLVRTGPNQADVVSR